jgi:hypothetical protein
MNNNNNNKTTMVDPILEAHFREFYNQVYDQTFGSDFPEIFDVRFPSRHDWFESEESYDYDEDSDEDFYILKDFRVSKEISDEVNPDKMEVRFMGEKEYRDHTQNQLGVVDTYSTLIDQRVCEAFMGKYDMPQKKPDDFDAIRIALKQVDHDLEPTDTFSEDEKRLMDVEEVLSDYFEVEDCHTIRIDPEKVTIYGEFGEKEETDLNQFCDYFCNFVSDISVLPDSGKSRKNAFVKGDSNFFFEYLESKTSQDFSDYKKSTLLGVGDPEIDYSNREIDRVGLMGSNAIEYFAGSFFESPENKNSTSRNYKNYNLYMGALLSETNLAINAVMIGMHNYFSIIKGEPEETLASWYENLVGSVAALDSDVSNTYPLLEKMGFNLYAHGRQKKRAKKLLKKVFKHVSEGTYCTYDYPNLKVMHGDDVIKTYYIPLVPFGRMRFTMYGTKVLSRGQLEWLWQKLHLDRQKLLSELKASSLKRNVQRYDIDSRKEAPGEVNDKEIELPGHETILVQDIQEAFDDERLVAGNAAFVINYKAYRDLFAKFPDLIISNTSSESVFRRSLESSFNYSLKVKGRFNSYYMGQIHLLDSNLVVYVLEVPKTVNIYSFINDVICYNVVQYMLKVEQ